MTQVASALLPHRFKILKYNII
ncbi:hypothetical protein CUJ84_pRLN2000028 (plasmid) [Rhizobium leguminosarum]|uniref:Uncharacterized protein n=1 Tax=Rhizobium leguminosarum TaxID=384 RepID=A0A2K9ZE90_RHILE|nr:hypothetical protein CUJ84_pRLN2000028 [Rhizobium leguminosarum]